MLSLDKECDCMLILLVFTLLVLFVMAMYFSKFDVMSPSIVLISGFLITSISSLYIYITSNMSIGLVTYLVIVTSIIFFLFGEIVAKAFVNSINQSVKRPLNSNRKNTNIDYNLPQWFLYLVVAFAFYTCIGQFEYILDSGRLFYKDGTTLELFAASRICVVKPLDCESVSFSTVLKLGLLITKSMSYFVVFLLIFKRDERNLKRKSYQLALYLILFFFCIQLLLSTARIGFIYFLIYVFVLWGFFQYKSEHTVNKAVKLIFKKAVIVFTFSCFLFYLLGYFTSKTTNISIVEMLLGYTGYQNFTLDYYLNNECNKLCSPIGPETFYGIRSTLYSFGIIDNWVKGNLRFVEVQNGQSTNIYTAIRRIISDFSLFGSYIYFFTLGVFYGVLHKKVNINIENDFSVVLYSMLLFPVFMIAWDERFTNIIFSVFLFVNIIIIYCLFYIFKRQK